AELKAMGDINLQLALAGDEAPAPEAGGDGPAGAEAADGDDGAEDDELSAGGDGSHELVAAPRDLDGRCGAGPRPRGHAGRARPPRRTHPPRDCRSCCRAPDSPRAARSRPGSVPDASP